MNQPTFLAAIRRRNEPEVPAPVEFQPRAATNPFARAADDLAVEWDQMATDLETARGEAEQHRGENIHLASEVDRLRKELETRTAFFDLEAGRLTARADRAVESEVAMRARFELIAKSLRMVLDEQMPVAQRKPEAPAAIVTPTVVVTATPQRNALEARHVPRERTFVDTPPEGHDVSDEDAQQASVLVRRLAVQI
jgi:hypothetical protein